MATIIKNINNGEKYFLVGTGFGAYKATRPSFFGGNLFPVEDEDTITVVAICDGNGKIHWIQSSEIEVVSIDGVHLSEIAGQLK